MSWQPEVDEIAYRHALAAKMGFALRHNVIEAHGLCAACVEVEACRHPEQCQHDHSVQVKKKPR